MVAPHLEKKQECFLSGLLPGGTMWDHVVRDRFFLRHSERLSSLGHLPAPVVAGLCSRHVGTKREELVTFMLL